MKTLPSPRSATMNRGGDMAQRISQIRERLAALLVQLEEDPTLDDIRLRAADLALDIALRDSDPFTADVVEALLADLPPQTSASVVKDLRDKATEARATRRAIAQSFGSRSQSNPASAPSQQTNQRTGFSGGF